MITRKTQKYFDQIETFNSTEENSIIVWGVGIINPNKINFKEHKENSFETFEKLSIYKSDKTGFDQYLLQMETRVNFKLNKGKKEEEKNGELGSSTLNIF